MIKNLKSALNGSAKLGAGREDGAPALDQESKRRQKQKEREARGKKLGSKKLASVVSRIRSITTNGKRMINKGPPTLAVCHKQPLLHCTEVEHAIEERGRDLVQGDEDALSFYSANEHFDGLSAEGQIDAIVATRHYDDQCSFRPDSSADQIAQTTPSTTKTSTTLDYSSHEPGCKMLLPEEQCDIPTFLYTKCADRRLMDETRALLRERHLENPDSFYDSDFERMLTDDWTVTRFLLRRRMDPRRTAKLMEDCGRFRKQFLMSEIKLWEFPREFHQAGGLFQYEPDRAGNQTMYMRVKMYRRVPEINDVFKMFILCVLEQCDVTSQGRGTAVVFDLTDCGLRNVDLSFLYWLLHAFRNYCPKGVSYIMVLNLPWFLSTTCKLAMTWMSTTNRRALRFVQGAEIENFIARENLPDYLGGTCKRSYRLVPPESRPAVEVSERLDISPQQAIKIRDMFKEYLDYDEGDADEGRGAAGASNDSNTGSERYSQRGLRNQNADRSASLASSSGGSSGSSQSRTSAVRVSNFELELLAAPADSGPQARRPSAGSLVPVVDLVSRASKFIVQ